MKKLQSILILFFLSVVMTAQNISVTDFRPDEMDQTANLQGTIVMDQNGEKCALIKVKTTQMGFNFDAGALGVTKTVQKTAEIWVYVPHGVRKLNISHQKFGQLDYQLPVTTQKAKTYIMDLKAETPLPVNSQRLTIKCQPKNAVVSIDGEMAEITNGVGEVILKLGSHKYVAMANGYYQTEGTVELKAERPGRLSIDLEAKEGTIVEQPKEEAAPNGDYNSGVLREQLKKVSQATSAYQKAFETAKAQELIKQQLVGSNITLRAIKDYEFIQGNQQPMPFNLVVANFGVWQNADAFTQKLVAQGYKPIVVKEKKMYRIIIFTSDNLNEIKSMKDKIIGTYHDAWLALIL